MRKARVLFLLLLLLVAGAYVALHGARSGWFGPSSVLDESAGPIAPAPGETQSATARPSFDIVRAEPDGSMIMAGRAEPGWTVTVESAGKPVGQAVADSNGEWVIEPTRKLAKGEHSLELRAQNAEGGRTLFSKQRLALSLSDPKRDQPLVALTEEGKSTRVLQMPPPSSEQADISVPQQRQASVEAAALNAPSAQSEKENAGSGNRVGFAAVDYEEAGEKSMLHMSGQATPGTRIVLYIDNQFAGMATADATGSWSYSGNKLLTGGNHTLRADLLDKGTTKVTGRAEVKFDRAAPNNLARADEENTKLAGADNSASGSVRSVRRQATASAEPAAAAPGTLTDRNGAVIVVRSGDTLWQIAQRHYGDGAKYTQIFKSNRKQIRDPNWIYPSQRFELPQ